MPIHSFLPAVVIGLAALLSAPGSTAQTPNLVADINTLPADAGFETAVRVGNRVFFTASTDCTGMELWVSDGTPAGTRPVKDIRPFEASSSPLSLTPFGDALLFMADDGVHGTELWRSDGTTSGTRIATDPIRPGRCSAYPCELTTMRGRLYFGAFGAATGYELWSVAITDLLFASGFEVGPGP